MTDFFQPSSPNINTNQPVANSPGPVIGTKKPADIWLIVAIILAVLLVLLSALSIWLFFQYNDQKTDVDGKITSAVTEAKKEQADEYEADFLEREKNPNIEFVGPEDYGSLSFMYPKTWSVYVDSDGSGGGEYRAYLNPKLVPNVDDRSQLFALRVSIAQSDYDDVVSGYDSLVKKGDLKSSSIKVNDVKGVRLDGQFNKDRRGSVVIFKIRDKTLSLSSDASVFKSDFDKLINTVKFNQ